MSDPKMQVIFVKQTGHVVAAFSRTADESKSKLEDIVGAGVPFRNMRIVDDTGLVTGNELVVIPAESLDVAIVDFDVDAFFTPLSFVTSGNKVDQLGSVTLPAPVLTASDITIKVTNPVAEKTKVWAVVQQVAPAAGEEPSRRIVQGEIDVNLPEVKLELKRMPDGLPASILSGNYDVLTLVAGQQRRCERKTIS